jgi:ubiquinone/menaquinone biosynthesis C-methylase UbiE
MRELQRQTKRIGTAMWRRINRRSTAGLGWKRQGDFITFKWDGFVAAPSTPMLFARHSYETAVIRRLVGDKSVHRSLEFGCGFGRLTQTFADLSAHHTAIDINADALATARVTYPHLEFVHSTGGRLPFDDAIFDLIVSWTVLQHVPPGLIDATLADLVRVLSPKGRILLCEETRSAGEPTRHSWHREPAFYEERLASLRVTYSAYIDQIDLIPGLVSPGRVMLFE